MALNRFIIGMKILKLLYFVLSHWHQSRASPSGVDHGQIDGNTIQQGPRCSGEAIANRPCGELLTRTMVLA